MIYFAFLLCVKIRVIRKQPKKNMTVYQYIMPMCRQRGTRRFSPLAQPFPMESYLTRTKQLNYFLFSDTIEVT